METKRLDDCPARAAIRSMQKTAAILVDDGLATGLTMALTLREVRHRDPSKVVVAVPVARPRTIAALRELIDEIVVLHTPEERSFAVGAFCLDFPQLTYENVREASSMNT